MTDTYRMAWIESPTLDCVQAHNTGLHARRQAAVFADVD
jgi:hypothetical protein